MNFAIIMCTIKLYVSYSDKGDPTYICEFCGEEIWFDERVNKKSKTVKPKFSLCCIQGKVQLPLLKDLPKLIDYILKKRHNRSNHFLENIRRYNMIMYSFTSMGGRIITPTTNSRMRSI